jgi:hypothetical protein
MAFKEWNNKISRMDWRIATSKASAVSPVNALQSLNTKRAELSWLNFLQKGPVAGKTHVVSGPLKYEQSDNN